MKRIEFILFKLIVAITSSLSTQNLYRVSAFFKFVLFTVIGYRKRVVLNNIKNSFPHLTGKEVKNLANDYFQNLCDLMIETFASYNWPESKLRQKFKFTNPEILENYVKEKKQLIGVAGHFGNFEIGAVSIPSQLHLNSYAVYRPIANRWINDYVVAKRTRTGVNIFDSKNLRTELETMSSPCILFLLADQSPSKIEKAYWVNFLHQETAFTHGPTDLAKSLGWPIIYIDIKTIKRGQYEAEISIAIEDPSTWDAQEIAQLLASKYEQTIRNSPSDWLWSHKRWKWKRVNGKPTRI